MTIDRSVLLALFRREPGHEALLDAIVSAGAVRLPAPALAAAHMIVAAQKDPLGAAMLHDLVCKLDLTVVPFGKGHCLPARDIFKAGLDRPRAGRPTFERILSEAVARQCGTTLLTSSAGQDDPRRL